MTTEHDEGENDPGVPCPRCKSLDTDRASGLAAGIETSYLFCLACGHQWGHE